MPNTDSITSQEILSSWCSVGDEALPTGGYWLVSTADDSLKRTHCWHKLLKIWRQHQLHRPWVLSASKDLCDGKRNRASATLDNRAFYKWRRRSYCGINNDDLMTENCNFVSSVSLFYRDCILLNCALLLLQFKKKITITTRYLLQQVH